MGDSSDSNEYTSPLERRVAAVRGKVLPAISRVRYETHYKNFCKWKSAQKARNVTENTILEYLTERSKVVNSATLWSEYSMLKSVLKIKDNIDIGRYGKVLLYLKRNSINYAPKRTNTLNNIKCMEFLKNAPDEEYLMLKISLIMGIYGGCRKNKLVDMKIDDIALASDYAIVTITDSKKPRKIIITNEDIGGISMFEMLKKYLNLRPAHTPHNRLFINYKMGKCTTQPVGKNTFGKIPSQIATFLHLPEPHLYSGHCFKHSSDSLMTVFGTDWGASTSTQQPFENEMHDYPHLNQSEELSTEEDIAGQDNDDNSETEESKNGILDIADTQILMNEAIPVHVNPQNPTPLECDKFGEYIAKHLQQLPVDVALKLQSGIQNLVMQTRLEYIREHPSEASPMVKQEPPLEEDFEESKTETVASEEAPEPSAKRFKPDKPRPETKESKTTTTHRPQNETRKTHCTVFAEHIAIQLEQLPEEVSLRLQSDIYALITQARPKTIDDSAPIFADIKAEPVDINEFQFL